MHQDRAQQRLIFAQQALGNSQLGIAPASNDASFRSYWHVAIDGSRYILMDAPSEHEDIRPWLDVAARLRNAGLHTPEVLASDPVQGFVLMEDLGTRTYLPELNNASVDNLYAGALDALLTMQTRVAVAGLPRYDEARLQMEMELLPEWFLQRHLGYSPNYKECDIIKNAFQLLIDSAMQQPCTFVHRDYHSRNLLITDTNSPGIIDFQDAVIGPITYDLVSLLRDCYIAWPATRVQAWVEHYRKRLIATGIAQIDSVQFQRWFDLMGLQRHIKVLGIFCRLRYRDGKAGYLRDLPMVLRYTLSVARGYAEFVDFANLLENAVGTRDLTQSRGETSSSAPANIATL